MESNSDSREGSSNDHEEQMYQIPLVDIPPERLEPSQQSDTEPFGRHRSKDPVRQLLPRKTSTVGPAERESWQPRVSTKKTGSKRRQMSNTLLFQQTDRQNMLKEPVVSETGDKFSSPKDSAYEPKSERAAIVNQLNKKGFSALHLAAQSNNLEEMTELLDSYADVDITSTEVGLTPLHFAARYGCTQAVRALINHGANCDASTTNGQRPIHLAARRGLADVIQVLMEADKGQVNVRNNDLITPLHMVALNGNVEALRLLITYGAKIDVKDINNISPIMLSVSSGHLDMTETILKTASSQDLSTNDILEDTDNEGNSLLHAAAKNGHAKLVEFLLRNGASVDVQKNSGQTPLHLAAVMGFVDMAAMMIEYEATIEYQDDELMTPLHKASMFNRLPMVKLLLENGAKINAVGKDGFTPLLLACWKGHADVVRELVAQKADITIKDHQLKTCLHWCVEMGHCELVDIIIESETGSELMEHQDKLDHSPMHYSAEIGNKQLMEMLISKGAKGGTRNVDEKTPLHIAAQFGHLSCVETFLKNFPNFLNDDDVDGNTPLLLASRGGHHCVILFLLGMGADIYKRNDEWKTVLSLAAQLNRMHTIAVLIEHNADINAQDRDKNTPLHLACIEGHYPAAKLLLRAGAELTHKNKEDKFVLDVAIQNRDDEIGKVILSSTQWESAMSNRDKQGLSPMKKLIEEMPNAAMIVMDYCVERSHKNPTHPDLVITYDHQYIDPGIDEHQIGKHGRFKGSKDRYFGLKTMAMFNREDLLSHELSQHILSRKWFQFAGPFYTVDFSFYLMFLGFLLYYTWSCELILSENQLDNNGCIIRDVNDTAYVFNEAGEVVRFSDASIIVAQFAVLIYCGFLCLSKVTDMLHQKLAFWMHLHNYFTLGLCVVCIMFVLPTLKPPCALQWQAGVIANYCIWLHLITYLQPLPFFGMYVGMFFTTLRSLLKAMTVYIFFIIAFGVSFYICFARLSSFKDVPSSLLTTFVMTLGELNKADIFESDPIGPFDAVAYTIFVIFLFFMPIVLINLTVGIAVGDIEKIFRTAYMDRLRNLVSLSWDYETKLPAVVLRRLHKSKTTARPNRRSVGKRGKLKRLLFGDEDSPFLPREEEDTSQCAPDNTADIRQIRGSLSIMDIVLQQHTDVMKKITEKFDIKHDFEDALSYKETVSSILH
ncbi:transient receptor potential cation channel subfamily A member 1-like [Asterias rubens]|uniref:transient receptor potential cation channel subfamily A member 1-like n=1 Tax=Asterias rubens TaxID=7604 RepID=UPI001454F05A|nr:transient receptor potential cation channel subfamily A member 1-like [Asterias rubens]XP_033631151.1 transient receptor potential cation channel subfamily A member 1-like [Asterias rubens]